MCQRLPERKALRSGTAFRDKLKKIIKLLLLIYFSALQSFAHTFIRDDIIQNPSPDRFSVCYNTGCSKLKIVSVSKQQWQAIRSIFTPSSTNAKLERIRIKVAILKMERYIGIKTGTSKDKGKNAKGFFSKTNQMDCIDESTNTTLYLTMMKKQGLIKLHSIEKISHRFFPLIMLPHSTAVIKEINTNKKFVVDSWFRDNGQLPYIILLSKWRKGWKPR